MRIISYLSILLFFLLLTIPVTSFIVAQTTEEYRWKNVQIKGGGFVTGMIYRQVEEGLLCAPTDVGGTYHWNAPEK